MIKYGVSFLVILGQILLTTGISCRIYLTAAYAESTPISRKEAVQYAITHAESIRMIKESSAVLRETGKKAAAFTKPQLTLSSAYVEMGDNLPENPFYSNPDRDMSLQLQAGQVLYAGGRIRSSLELDKQFGIQADMLEKMGVRDLKKQVQTAFDAVLFRKASIDILKDRVKQRQNELEDAKDLREAGVVASLDVRQAQLILNLAEEELHAAETAYQESLIDFNLAVGRSGNDPFFVPDGSLEESENMKLILERLDEQLSANTLIDYQWAKIQADISKLTYDIAKGERLPEVMLAGSGKSNGEQIGDMNESWTIGIQAKWNILDGGLIQAKTASAKADMKKADENLSLTQKMLAGEIEKIRSNIASLDSRIELQKQSVGLSKQNYEDARGQYRAGMITLTQVGDFNLGYAEARFNLIKLYFMQREQVVRAESLGSN